jgi:Zn-dependent protease
MKKSLRVGTVSGIDVFLHWTFLVMMAGFFVFYLYTWGSVVAALAGIGLMATVFVCVVLHELGHAMMARRFGIPTLDITLYPIGGVARLQRMPREPRQELWIALAGPAVNLAIAGVLYLVIGALGQPLAASAALASPANVLGALMWFNLLMVGFNLIPAFPMDGGRVLRAGLANRIGYSRATQIAGVIGQFIALLMAIFGIFSGQYTLIFIAVFVIFAAQQEMKHAIMK